MAGRGAAARGVGPRRQRPEAAAGGRGARASRAVAGNRRPGEPPSRGTGPAAAPWAYCPLTCLCSRPPSSGAAATRRRRPRGARGWVSPGSEGPCGGVVGPGRTWEPCAGGNEFPSTMLTVRLPVLLLSPCLRSVGVAGDELVNPHRGSFGLPQITLVWCPFEFCLLPLGLGMELVWQCFLS